MGEDSTEATLPFLEYNTRGPKPRTTGLTEIRGPYYYPVGPNYLADLIAIGGQYMDWFKIPAPGVALVPKSTLTQMIDLCHKNQVEVSAGGLVEYVLTKGSSAVDRYFDAVRDLGFDVVEVSVGMLSITTGDFLKLVERAKKTGLKVKAEVGIQFGAGGSTSAEALEAEGTASPAWAVKRGKMALEAGADMIILESEGVTESVKKWRTDVPGMFIAEIGLEKMMFEAADPKVFEWYIKSYGPDVNLFVDHSQILSLESVRSGIWATNSLWGRVVSYTSKD